jgi:hypothetical protein
MDTSITPSIMPKTDITEACGAAALRDAVTAGLATAVVSGAAVLTANAQSAVFARSLGISGKVALVVMP